jgi:hypothetical protein
MSEAPTCSACKQKKQKADGKWVCYTLGCPKNQIPISG